MQNSVKFKTRFAPSPTGFIHLGNIRSALYPWAFARSSGGGFVMRIEDTDEERNSQAAVDVILESMQWLGLDFDEGPYYQSQRMERYKEVLSQMLSNGQVYPCYMSVAELDALRERQMANKEKPRYDGTWRPEEGKTLPPVPQGVNPVLRFKNPLAGAVVWEDKVKGRIEIKNAELDDLVVARPAPLGEIGTPTYNFCVVVDDMDMGISHVIRGDDHVNNTPRQINIFNALGYPVPTFAHLPTVLNEAGEKMSKRSGAKAVTQYRDEGYLPDAMVNYLARLGWSHGDDEVFSRRQFLDWFNLDHLGRSAAQFDEAKLRWVNAQHIKMATNAELVEMLKPLLAKNEIELTEAAILGLCALYKDRAETLLDIVDWARKYLSGMTPNADELKQHVTDAIRPAIKNLGEKLAALDSEGWTKEGVSVAFKATLAEYGLKMPQLAMPVRVLALGTAHTPSVDAALALFNEFDKNILLERLSKA